jgi:hypothetical protein
LSSSLSGGKAAPGRADMPGKHKIYRQQFHKNVTGGGGRAE